MHQHATSTGDSSYPLPLSATAEHSSAPSLKVVPETRELSQSLCDTETTAESAVMLPDGAVAVSLGLPGSMGGEGENKLCCEECRPMAKVRWEGSSVCCLLLAAWGCETKCPLLWSRGPKAMQQFALHHPSKLFAWACYPLGPLNCVNLALYFSAELFKHPSGPQAVKWNLHTCTGISFEKPCCSLWIIVGEARRASYGREGVAALSGLSAGCLGAGVFGRFHLAALCAAMS